ncbi:MAG: hypothetical protein ABFD20_03575 [Anaerolineales bacterium]
MSLSGSMGTEPVGAAPPLVLVRRGAWVDADESVALIEPPSAETLAARGRLAYLLQSADARPLNAALTQLVAQTLYGAYYAAGGDVPLALRQGLLAANRALFEHNVRADADSRLLLGAACAVVLGTKVYLARLGPACLCVLGDQGAMQFPAHSRWPTLEGTALDRVAAEPPLGLQLEVEPDIWQVSMPSDGHLVLLSLVAQRVLALSALGAWLAQGDVPAIRQALDAADRQDVSLLAIPLAAQGPGRAAESPSATDTRTAPTAAGRAPWLARTKSPEVSLVTDHAPQEPTQPTPSAAPRSRRLTGAPSAVPPTPTWEDELADDLDDLDAEDAAMASTAERGAAGPASETVRGAGRALRSSAKRVRNGAEDVLLKVLPDRLPERPEPQTRTKAAMSPASQSLVIVALLLPLLVLFTVIMVRVQYNRELDSRRGSIRDAALSEYDAAINAASPELRADGLDRTMDLVESGLAILPEDEILVDLRMRTLLKLDEVERVERLFHFKKLDTYTVGGTVVNEPSRVVINDKDALVLNKGAGQVYAYTLSDVGDAVSSRSDTRVALREGDTVGGTKVGKLVDMTYLAATGSRTTGNIAVLDRDGTLWTLRTNGFEPVPVADSDSWLKPVAIGAYQGNLYVLDPLAGTILKYLPSDNAYTTPPFTYLSSTVTVDMLGAVDMAIDGNVYVLFADGTVHKFFNGEEQPFPMTGLPSKMSNPTSIFVSGAQEPDAAGYIYVTDRGNERIVQFDKQGNYVRSFKANTSEPYMAALGGVYVDESTARMFIFSERYFVLVSLPALAS